MRPSTFACEFGSPRVERLRVEHATFAENRDHRKQPFRIVAELAIIRSAERFDTAPQLVDRHLRTAAPPRIREQPHQRVDAQLPRREGVCAVRDRGAFGASTDIVVHAPSFGVSGTDPLAPNESAAMKIACSSASFASALRAGTLTHLEWLDACANELEVDGIVFGAGELPRDDAEYLAQLKKLAVDLGLGVAAVDADATLDGEAERWLDIAATLGAPLVMGRAPATRDDPTAWGAFTDCVRHAAGVAKRRNVTLALRNAPGTLCASVADCKRLVKDVDSAWLRYALASDAFGAADDVQTLLAKSVIATHAIADLDAFATAGDVGGAHLVDALARFRGFLILEHAIEGHGDAYHRAVERFTNLREKALVASAHRS